MSGRAAVAGIAVCLLAASTVRAQKHRPTAPDLAHCPISGSADSASDHALLNIAKHQRPMVGATPTHIRFNDVGALQDSVDSRRLPMGRGTDLTAAQRQDVRGLLDVNGTRIGEGTFVQLEAFITDDDKNPRFNKGESVTCYLPDKASNDIHINVVSEPENDEFSGMVVEMVPYDRPSYWNLKNLRLVRKAHRKVLIRGVLLFDNAHVPRTDCGDEQTDDEASVCVDRNASPRGNPARFAVWEIHPVTEFRVCMRTKNDCSATALAEWTPVHKIDVGKLKALIEP